MGQLMMLFLLIAISESLTMVTPETFTTNSTARTTMTNETFTTNSTARTNMTNLTTQESLTMSMPETFTTNSTARTNMTNLTTQGTLYGNHFEGDIALRNSDRFAEKKILQAFVIHEDQRWGKTIQFSIGIDLFKYRSLIFECLEWIADRSCLSFIEGSTGDHIKFTSFGDLYYSGSGCWSYIGRKGGEQVVNLEIPGCTHRDIIFHEIFHALGTVHEQSRPDRDHNVKILLHNIKENKTHNFKIRKDVDPAQTPYDLVSIMHYAPNAFGRNGLPTIEAKAGPDVRVGGASEPTETDLYELNHAYGCPQGNCEVQVQIEKHRWETEKKELKDTIKSLKTENDLQKEEIRVLTKETLNTTIAPPVATEIHKDSSFTYFKVKVAYGTRMTEGSVPETCRYAGMMAVCGGPADCQFSGSSCVITPVSTRCGYPMYPIAKILCPGKIPDFCDILDSVFNYMKGYRNYGEIGYVGGEPVDGNEHTSSRSFPLFAFCGRKVVR